MQLFTNHNKTSRQQLFVFSCVCVFVFSFFCFQQIQESCQLRERYFLTAQKNLVQSVNSLISEMVVSPSHIPESERDCLQHYT